MPITITLPQPHGMIGPFQSFPVVSTFIGPFPQGTNWVFSLTMDSEGSQVIASDSFPCIGNSTTAFIGDIFENAKIPLFLPKYGDTIFVQAKIVQPGNVTVDSGTQQGTFTDTQMLLNQIEQVRLATSSPSFSTTDRANLNATLANTQTISSDLQVPVTTKTGTQQLAIGQALAMKLIDTITLAAVNGSPTGSPVTADISTDWIFGVIVRIASFPSWWTPQTPDNDWYKPDFAVLTIFRGTDKERRVPIHTSTHMEAPLPGYNNPWIAQIALGTTPPLTSIEVDWAEGVTGQVFLMRFP